MAEDELTEVQERSIADFIAEAGFGSTEHVRVKVYHLAPQERGGTLAAYCLSLGPFTGDELAEFDIQEELQKWATAHGGMVGVTTFLVRFFPSKGKSTSYRMVIDVPQEETPPDGADARDSRAELLEQVALLREISGLKERKGVTWTPEGITALVTAGAGALASIAGMFKGSGGNHGPSVTELLTLMESARTNGLKLGEELGESKAAAPTGASALDLGIAALNKLPEAIGQLAAARTPAAGAPRPAVTQAQPAAPALAQPTPETSPASELDPTPEESETMFFQLRMTKLVNLLVDAMEKDDTLTAEQVLDLVDEKLTARDRDTLADLVERVGVEAACEFLGGQLAATRPEGVRHVEEGGRIRAALAALVSTDAPEEEAKQS